MTTLIRQYWDARAQRHPRSFAATTNDIHLRELEFRTLKRHIAELQLPADARVLDVGCGDGATTIRLAQALPSLRFTGIDFASAMIEIAQEQLSQSPHAASRVEFAIGDVTQLIGHRSTDRFEAAISCRCLINLPDVQAQQMAISQIAARLAPAAVYLAIENFHEGHDQMNLARNAVGLPAIPIRWHNRYFTEAEFGEIAKSHFAHVAFIEFASAYYYATRVIYSKMCMMRGEEPDYDHEIHRLAVDLAPHGCFSPVRLAILHRSAPTT